MFVYTYSSHLKLVFYFVCLIHKHFFLHVCTCNVCMARVECTLFFYYVYFVCLSTIITWICIYLCFDSRFGASKSCSFCLLFLPFDFGWRKKLFPFLGVASLTMLSLLTHERQQEKERTRTHTQCQFISAVIMYAMYCLSNQPFDFVFFFSFCVTPIARSLILSKNWCL